MRIVVMFLFAALLWGCSEDPVPEVGTSCASMVDCAEGDRLSCRNGVCVRISCSGTAQCPASAACVGGFCDAPECAETADCASGVCFEGDCRADLCDTKAECGSGEVCQGTPPTCRLPPSTCINDDQCPVGLSCVLPFGTCKSSCNFDSDCTGTDYCRRGACTPPCGDSSVCTSEEACVGSRCVELQPCPTQTCPPSRPFRNPIDCSCVECLNGSDCFGNQENCTPSGRCIYCPAMGDAADCQRQGLIEDEGCCTQCINDIDCEGDDQVCTSGICVFADPRECTLDEDCSGSSTCENGLCRPGGSLDMCALQTECADGEACYGDGRCRLEGDCTCLAPSRCVAEPGDTIGSCVGCTANCGTEGCDTDEVCVVRGETTEGICVPAVFSGCP